MPADGRQVNRRHFLQRSALCTVGGAASLGFYAWRIAPHWIEVVERDMPLAGLPDSLVGKRVLQISDVHVSKTVSYPYLQHSMGQVVDLDPDIIMITGDLTTSHAREQVEPTVRLLRELGPGVRPVYATLGNHDYGSGCRQMDVAAALQNELSRVGVRVLRNELADDDGLQIVGFDDWWAGKFEPTSTLATLDTSRPAIAMTHNPDTVDLGGWAGFQGWILAGHTHGGQCRAPLYGPPILPIRNPRYAAGHVDLGDGRQLYVNRGLGYTKRVRFLCPPEMTVFRLTRATA